MTFLFFSIQSSSFEKIILFVFLLFAELCSQSEKFFSLLGMSAAEFSLTIIEKLLVKRSSEDLQAELFDLCGFERFDMISSILDKREGLVAAHKVRRAGHSRSMRGSFVPTVPYAVCNA